MFFSQLIEKAGLSGLTERAALVTFSSKALSGASPSESIQPLATSCIRYEHITACVRVCVCVCVCMLGALTLSWH